jgi:gliding motility-associated-like protein
VVDFLDSTKMSSGESHSFLWRAGDNSFTRVPTDTLYNYSGKDAFLPIEAVYTSANGCVSKSLKDSLLQLRPQPRAAFSYLPTEITSTDPFVQFTDESRDANYWGWSFGDGTTEKERNPSKLYADAGEYQVLFWTRNIFNCTDTAFATLKVEPGNRLFVPNSFSPNQDNLNDLFKIYGLETATEAVLRVYDRWGQEVWKGDILNSSWNGTNKKGKLVSSGVYLIYLKYSIDSRVYEFNNSLTILGAE